VILTIQQPEEETAMEVDENGSPGDKTSLPGSKQSSSLEKPGILSKQNSMTDKLGAKQSSKGALRELTFPAIKVNVLEHDENQRPRKVHFAGEQSDDQVNVDRLHDVTTAFVELLCVKVLICWIKCVCHCNTNCMIMNY